MSFRENLQHLRASRNMTQEQLAMLLGVSRQSVSKWEAERAYPEMDKLLRLCDLFECTLDDLVTGDMTARSADAASGIPSGKAPQDVTGYDQTMRAFAWKLPLGIAVIILGAALSMLIAGIELVPGIELHNYACIAVLVGIAAGLALILPVSFERSAFRKAHPFVEDFYTADQKSQAHKMLSTGIVAGVGFIVAGLVVAIALQVNPWFSSAAFFALTAVGVFCIVRGSLFASRCNLETYNHRSLCDMSETQINELNDEELAERARRAKYEHRVYIAIMCAATAVGLILLFIPQPGVQRMFWLAWPVGGLLCGVVRVFCFKRSEK